MALVLKDRVKETTTTTGTGTYTLAGAVTGFEAFSEIGDGNTTYYCCSDGIDFEVGVGTYTASGTTLARTTILQSSNSDAAVNWTAGTRSIFITQPAEKALFLDASDNFSSAATSVTLSAINAAIDSNTDSINIGDGSGGGTTPILGHNTVVGNGAGATLSTGGSNTFLGADSGATTTTSNRNVYIGKAAGDTMFGSNNVVVGTQALASGSAGADQVVAIGYQAALYNQADDNVFVGSQAGRGDTTSKLTGAQNVAIGTDVMYGATTATRNVVVGYQAGNGMTNGVSNVFVGHQAGTLVTSGSFNVVIGTYDGNSGGIDIRTSNSNIVLADGNGNIRAYFNSSGVPQFAGINYPTSDGSANQVLTTDGSGTLSFSSGMAAPQAINAQTGTTYTTVLSDAGKLVTLSNASAITLTIPPNSSVAYAVGTRIDFIQIGAGQVTVAGGIGVTVNSTPTLKFRAQHSAASCIKIATDTWQLVGDLAES